MHMTTDQKTRAEKTRYECALCPPADVQETDEHFLILMELPGVRPEDVNLEVEEDELRLTASRPSRKEEPHYLLQERSERTLRRVFRLSDAVDREGITGKLADGILTIRIPKTVRTLARKVKIA